MPYPSRSTQNPALWAILLTATAVADDATEVTFTLGDTPSLSFLASPTTLYTVELWTGHSQHRRSDWSLGHHLLGHDGPVHLDLADHFSGLDQSPGALFRVGTYPDPDADPDGDGFDTRFEATVSRSDPRRADADADGLTDPQEFDMGTDPDDPDTDGDGLLDPDEPALHGTDPTRADSDADGLSDSDEIATYGTDPTAPDSDGDGRFDGYEIALDRDPNAAAPGTTRPTGLVLYRPY